jgi:hypothetical protein
MNERAASNARRLCDALQPGMTEGALMQAAGRSGARVREGRDKREYFFQGSVFNGSTCRASLAEGRVTRVEVSNERD